ncbi:hypothetical protein ACHWQZ_G016078 [Mnemiopsis leidyi]
MTSSETPKVSTNKNFAESYNVLKPLAEGETSTIWLVKRISDGALCAAKLVADSKCLRKTWCAERKEKILDEILLSETLDHPNILDLQEIFYTGRFWILVMDYFPDFVDLSDYIVIHGAMSVCDAREIVTQLLDTCLYLISLDIDHRDIRVSNILYNPSTRRIKLIDFGSACKITPLPYTSTPSENGMFLPPEYHRTGTYSPLAGLTWSIGILAYILLTGLHPFLTERDILEYTQLKFLNTSLDEDSREFLQDVLKGDDEARLSPSQLTLHPWLDWISME